MEIRISKKQEYVLKSRLHRINILEGSVRSGKTWISLVLWCMFVAAMPRDAEFLMCGKTLTTLHRNCLNLLAEFDPDFRFSLTGKRAELYGRRIWLEGADNIMSENKIRGMTLSGAYVDELTLIPEGFYNMLLSRLSEPNACLIATTNPDSPNHYVYQKIILNPDVDKKVTKFSFTDNTVLMEKNPEYMRELPKEYSGVFYQRYILGEWVLAEGLVYPMYDNTVPTVERPYSQYILSMDYGIQNPTAMLLMGLYNGVWYVIKEYYHSGRTTNAQKTDEQYYEELEKLCGDVIPRYIYIDPSAASFIQLVMQKGKYHVRRADNSVLEGIQHVASAFSNKMIMVNDCCKNLIAEMGLYSWNDKAGDDTVIKENDHACDALRYAVQTARLYKKIEPFKGVFER